MVIQTDPKLLLFVYNHYEFDVATGPKSLVGEIPFMLCIVESQIILNF